MLLCVVLFFNVTATTEIYTLSLHDALPISGEGRARQGAHPGCDRGARLRRGAARRDRIRARVDPVGQPLRSEEHTSELQSHVNLVCRLLLEKKKNRNHSQSTFTRKQQFIVE